MKEVLFGLLDGLTEVSLALWDFSKKSSAYLILYPENKQAKISALINTQSF